MKKLMFALAAIVGMSISVSAANFNWYAYAVTDGGDGSVVSTWTDSQIYVLADGVSLDATQIDSAAWFVDALNQDNFLALSDADGNPIVGAKLYDQDGVPGTDSRSMNFGADNDILKTFNFVVVDDEKGWFTFESELQGYSTTSTPDDPNNYIFAEAITAGWEANGSAYSEFAVPEPTSGLLLLLGVAGLALKRKQA